MSASNRCSFRRNRFKHIGSIISTEEAEGQRRRIRHSSFLVLHQPGEYLREAQNLNQIPNFESAVQLREDLHIMRPTVLLPHQFLSLPAAVPQSQNNTTLRSLLFTQTAQSHPPPLEASLSPQHL